MKAGELRDLSMEELEQRLQETLKESFDLRVMKAAGKIENPLRLRGVRRDIAKIKTVLRERRQKT